MQKEEVEYKNDEELPFKSIAYVKFKNDEEAEKIIRFRDEVLENRKLIEEKLKTLHKFSWRNYYAENEISEHKSIKDNAV